MRKCNLIIDSCCDLPSEYINVEGVDLIKFPYLIDGVAYDDDMFTLIKPHDFYEAMRKGATPTTSQASPARYQEAFEKAAKSGIPTVYLSFTSALSKSYDSACLIKDQICGKFEDAEIYVVDTLLPSLCEGLLVVEAINQMNEGLTALELVKWVEEARHYVDAAFMVEDLDALHRGGRIPQSAAVAGGALKVKPLLTLTLEGGLKLGGVARGRKKGISQLASWYEKNAAKKAEGQYVIIGNADCPSDAKKLKELLLKQDETLMIIEGNIGPVIGSHTGAGMLAVVYWCDDRRQNLSISEKIANKVKGAN